MYGWERLEQAELHTRAVDRNRMARHRSRSTGPDTMSTSAPEHALSSDKPSCRLHRNETFQRPHLDSNPVPLITRAACGRSVAIAHILLFSGPSKACSLYIGRLKAVSGTPCANSTGQILQGSQTHQYRLGVGPLMRCGLLRGGFWLVVQIAFHIVSPNNVTASKVRQFQDSYCVWRASSTRRAPIESFGMGLEGHCRAVTVRRDEPNC